MRSLKPLMFLIVVSAVIFSGEVICYEGQVIHTGSKMVTVKMSRLEGDLTGAEIEMTYMAGMLPMAIGRFKVASCVSGTVELIPVSVTMPPSKDMNVTLDVVSAGGKEKAPHGLVAGTVVGLDNDSVKIDIAAAVDIKAGSRADLYYKSSSGEEILVGEWKVTNITGRRVLAEPVNMMGDPMIGLVAKITPSKIKTPDTQKSDLEKIPGQGNVRVKKDAGIMITNPLDKLEAEQRTGKKGKSTLEQAAEKGDSQSQNKLGWHYQKGINVKQDYQKAFFWYEKAARQGHQDAQNNLGFMYQKGWGVKKEVVKAVYWYRKAADQGYACAQDNLGWMYQTGTGVEKSMTQSVLWYKKSALQDYTNSQNNLGWMYQKGLGVDQSHEQAVYWYQKAAEKGHKKAQNNLAWMCQKGLGVAQSHEQAVHWYQKAAEQENSVAQNNLGWMYQKGLGVPADRQTAVFWYKKAAKNGNKHAKNNLKNMGENF